MYEPRLMNGRERFGNAMRDMERLGLADGTRAKAIGKRLPLYELHHEVGESVDVSYFENGGETWMPDARKGYRLTVDPTRPAPPNPRHFDGA